MRHLHGGNHWWMQARLWGGVDFTSCAIVRAILKAALSCLLRTRQPDSKLAQQAQQVGQRCRRLLVPQNRTDEGPQVEGAARAAAAGAAAQHRLQQACSKCVARSASGVCGRQRRGQTSGRSTHTCTGERCAPPCPSSQVRSCLHGMPCRSLNIVPLPQCAASPGVPLTRELLPGLGVVQHRTQYGEEAREVGALHMGG